jgi:L-aspartate oxidase
METDFLVIGSGIAGLNFALKAAEHGTVAVITKKETMESNTNYAQGGIAAVISPIDKFRLHIKDTLQTGCGLANKRAVEVLVKEGPKEIRELIKLGVGFSRIKGKLCLTREGGHSRKRIVFSKDATGREVERTLVFNIRNHRNINVYEQHIAIDLIIEKGRCIGARVFDIKKQILNVFFAKVTILATGGLGKIYAVTSNPDIATGDGIAMAYKVGAQIEDIEFVQFHPTTLNKKGAPHSLISETVRGEGGILRNSQGEAFMERYHQMKELAPRDVVARAIVSEMKKGQVFLDIRHRGERFIRKRFPTIYKKCLRYEIDMAKDLIPVTPAAHYACGGVKTNIYGETNIKGLYALGEVACTEVHGANRLASNSLLESLVFSSLTAKKTRQYVKGKKVQSKKVEEISAIKKNKKTRMLAKEIQKLMWEKVGIIRNGEGLESALQELAEIKKEADKIEGMNEEVIELKNMVIVSQLVTKAALMRKESRGTHFREDYPKTDKVWERHIVLEKNSMEY